MGLKSVRKKRGGKSNPTPVFPGGVAVAVREEGGGRKKGVVHKYPDREGYSIKPSLSG